MELNTVFDKGTKMRINHKEHFNTTAAELWGENSTVAMESVEAAIAGLLILPGLAFMAWDKYDQWRKNADKHSGDPDRRAKSYRYNTDKLVRVTRERIQKTYLNEKWLDSAKIHSGEVDGSRIIPLVSSNLQVTIEDVAKRFDSCSRTIKTFSDQVNTVTKAHDDWMKAKIQPLMESATEDNADETAATIAKLAKSIKLPCDKITQLPAAVNQVKQVSSGRNISYGPVIKAEGAKLPALNKEQLLFAGQLMLKMLDLIEYLFNNQPYSSFYWDDVKVVEELQEDIIDDPASLDLWYEPEGDDAHRHYAHFAVSDELIGATVAIERWAHYSIKSGKSVSLKEAR